MKKIVEFQSHWGTELTLESGFLIGGALLLLWGVLKLGEKASA
jgi:hypothetical protein